MRRSGRGRDLLAHDMPEALGGGIEATLHHRVEAARALAARHDPAFVAQDLEVSAHRRLRKLEHGAELSDHELPAVEQQQDSAARRVGESADAVEDGNRHEKRLAWVLGDRDNVALAS